MRLQRVQPDAREPADGRGVHRVEPDACDQWSDVSSDVSER
jgi:hypothetical protein